MVSSLYETILVGIQHLTQIVHAVKGLAEESLTMIAVVYGVIVVLKKLLFESAPKAVSASRAS